MASELDSPVQTKALIRKGVKRRIYSSDEDEFPRPAEVTLSGGSVRSTYPTSSSTENVTATDGKLDCSRKQRLSQKQLEIGFAGSSDGKRGTDEPGRKYSTDSGEGILITMTHGEDEPWQTEEDSDTSTTSTPAYKRGNSSPVRPQSDSLEAQALAEVLRDGIQFKVEKWM